MANDTLSKLRTGELAGAKRLDLRGEGITEFPREVFDLADSLEILDLSQNQLTDLPQDLGRLTKLRILFCSSNPFAHVPEVIADCRSLSMVGFKSCHIEQVDAEALSPVLRWLILTDNRITELPATIGNCRRMQKLMLSGNQLSSLPEEMANCENLELLRIAANRFEALPDWLYRLPRLAWLAIAGNPFTASETRVDAIAEIPWTELSLQHQLGEGASGVIHRGEWRNGSETTSVAVKLFKGSVTSDGLPESEMAACLAAGRHENLVGVLGKVSDHPQGSKGLVMPLIGEEFSILAGPPDFDSCTRDVYAEGTAFSAPVALRIAQGLASAAAHLHARRLIHGDLYAHNLHVSAQGDCLLGDFGGATPYPESSPMLEHIEVRAFGILLEELLQRSDCAPSLRELQKRCVDADVSKRPTFAAIADELMIGAI